MIESNHLLSINSLSDAAIGGIFAEALLCLRGDYTPFLAGKVIQSVFLENSTRTRVSFEMAASRLGAMVVGLSEVGSSMAKGESVTDTLATLAAMRPDAMIVRLSQAGELERLAATSKFPIICAGEGGVHHPTQALLDAFTIMRAKQTFTGRVVAICGDVLRSRVANSGAELLKRLGAKVRVVAPEAMQPQDGFVDCERFTDLKTGIQGVDVIMALRTQLERTSSAVCLPDSFRLDHEIIKLAQPDVVVMHPGPMHRDSEITSELADDKRYSLVAEQVTNGVAVRMAVLKYCFGK